MRANEGKVTVARHQNESIFPAGRGNEDIIRKRPRSLAEGNIVLSEQCREDTSAFLECRSRWRRYPPAAFKYAEDAVLQRVRLLVGNGPGSQLLHHDGAHKNGRSIAFEK